MSIADEFEENRNFFDPENPGKVDPEAFKRFVEKYGPEVTKGYLMALIDVHPHVADVYCKYADEHWTGLDVWHINSYTVMRNKANSLTLHIGDVLQAGSALTGYPQQSYFDLAKVPRRNLES